MLNKVAIIASVICGLTAITTSLRAVGVSREKSGNNLGTGSRISDYKMRAPSRQRNSLRLYFIVSIIWYLLSLAFAVPVIIGEWKVDAPLKSLLWFIPFLVLVIILYFIWGWARKLS